MNRNARRRLERAIAKHPEIAEARGSHILEWRHSDWCPAWRTHSLNDCICDPEVSMTEQLDPEEWCRRMTEYVMAARRSVT